MSETNTSFEWRILHKSVTGASHKRANKPNQDAFLLRQDTETGLPLFLAIADGHGEEQYYRSHKGSAFAVQAAEQEILSLLKMVSGMAISIAEEMFTRQLPRKIVARWNRMVSDDWNDYPHILEERIIANHKIPYGTTLLTVIITEAFICYLQLGDGNILTISRTGHISMPVKSHEHTGSFYNLNAELDFRTQFVRVTPDTLPAMIMLSSDGYSDSFHSPEDFHKASGDIWNTIHTQGIETVENNLVAWLEKATLRSEDDITLGLLCRMSAIQKAKKATLAPQKLEKITDEQIGQRLYEIVQGYTPAFWRNPRRCKGLLLDYTANRNLREINVLITVLAEGIVEDLEKQVKLLPVEAVIQRSASQLYQDNGLALDIAQWSVETWLYALHLSTEPISKKTVTLEAVSLPPSPVQKAHKINALSASAPAVPQTPRQSESQASKKATIITVSPKPGHKHYQTIAAALANAHPGSRIIVFPGTYKEKLYIDKDIEIIGQGPREIIQIAGAVPCIEVGQGQVRLQGLTIRGSVQEMHNHSDNSALFVRKGHITIIGCYITSQSSCSIRLAGEHTRFHLEESRIADGQGSGLLLAHQAKGYIVKCSFENNAGHALSLVNSLATIEDCTIRNNQGCSIAVNQQSDATIRRSSIIQNSSFQPSSVGIGIWNSSLTVKDLTISQHHTGIYLENCQQAKLEGCAITDSTVGIYQASSTSALDLSFCTFTKCKENVVQEDIPYRRKNTT